MEIRSIIYKGAEMWCWFNIETGTPESPLFISQQECEQYFKTTTTFH